MQQDRYLWVQVAAIAAVPLLMEVVLIGLSSAAPAWDYPVAYGLQFWMIVLIGVVPGCVMQCWRPFYIYCLPPLALRPSRLTINQRRRLTVLMSWQVKAIALLTAFALVWTLSRLYSFTLVIAPRLSPTAGLFCAIAALFTAGLIAQVGTSALRAILISPTALERVEPAEVETIPSSFFIPGLRIDKILPVEQTVRGPLSDPAVSKVDKGDEGGRHQPASSEDSEDEHTD